MCVFFFINQGIVLREVKHSKRSGFKYRHDVSELMLNDRNSTTGDLFRVRRNFLESLTVKIAVSNKKRHYTRGGVESIHRYKANRPQPGIDTTTQRVQ